MNALAPAKVIAVELFEDDGVALVIVPDYQLSLAIGRDGQNVRLAARLTGWRLDIASESESAQARERYLAERAERAVADPSAAAEAPEAVATEGGGDRRRAHTQTRRVSARAPGLRRNVTEPVRSCVGCRRRFAQNALVRFVRTQAGWCADLPAHATQATRTWRLSLLDRVRAARGKESPLPGAWHRGGRIWFNREPVQEMNS